MNGGRVVGRVKVFGSSSGPGLMPRTTEDAGFTPAGAVASAGANAWTTRIDSGAIGVGTPRLIEFEAGLPAAGCPFAGCADADAVAQGSPEMPR